MDALTAQERAVLQAHAVDSAVALVAGAASPEGRELAGLRAQPSLAAEQAALAAAIIRSTEVDDIHIESCVTPTSVAMPAAFLAMPEPQGDVENALRIAVELSVRMGLAIEGPHALYRGIWPTCLATPFAVAAALCRLSKLDEAHTIQALSLALMMSSGRIGKFSGQPTGRWIILNAAFVTGVRAVDAARHRFKGDSTLLDGPWLENAIGFAPRVDALTENLPRSLALQGLGLKPFSTARQALSPTQALMDVLSEGLDPHNIDSIDVFVPQAYAAMISRPLEPYRSSTYSNVAFQMALAALRPDQLLDLDRSSVINDPAILHFMKRIRVSADENLQADYPRIWGGEVHVHHRGGTVKKRVLTPRGDANCRLSEAALQTKHQRLLTDALGIVEGQNALDVLNVLLSAPQPARVLMQKSLSLPALG